MPIPTTDPAARLRARQLGLDPDEVDLVSIAQEPQQTVAPQTQPTPPESTLSGLWKAANTGIKFDPKFLSETSPVLSLLPDGIKNGLAEAGSTVLEGATSPIGLGTLAATPLLFPATAAGQAIPLISKVAAGVFGGLGLKGAYESGKEVYKDYQEGKGTEALTKDSALTLANLAQMIPGLGMLLKGKKVGGLPIEEAPAKEVPLKVMPPEQARLQAPPETKLLPESATLPTRVVEPPLEIPPQALAERVPQDLGNVAPPIEELPGQRVDIKSELPKQPTEVPPVISEPPSRIPWGFSELDRIQRIGTPEAKTAAEGLEAFLDRKETLRGQFVNDVQNKLRAATALDSLPKSAVTNPLEFLRQETPETRAAVDSFFSSQDGVPPQIPTPKVEQIKGIVRDYYKAVRQAQRSRPGLSEDLGPDNPEYLSNMAKGSVMKVMTQTPEAPEALKLSKDFVDYQLKTGKAADPIQAEQLLQKVKDSWAQQLGNKASHYGPIDENAGVGLPPSWREGNLFNILHRYGDRVAGRFAWHDTVETNPKVQAALETYKNNDSVKSVMRQVGGTAFREHPIPTAIAGIFKAGAMQTLSGVRDFITAPFVGMRYHSNPVQGIGNFLKSFTQMKQNIADSWVTGRIRHNQSSLEINLGMDDLTPLLRRTRDVMSDATARNWADRMSRATLMGDGKLTTIDYHNQFLKGKLGPQGKAWFENFGKGVSWTDPVLTPEEIRTIASRYVDKTQGTYDPRGVPKVAYEGGLSPVLSLMRWGLEQSNNFIKHSVQPAIQDHNFTPLLNDTIGILVGGTAIKMLSSVISGRKQKEPTFGELVAQPSAMGTAYWLSGLAAAAGNVGFIGDAMKSILDLTYGKNKPQEINNILISSTTAIGQQMASLANAAVHGEADIGTVGETIHNILSATLQNYRLIANHLDKEKLDFANKKRDLKVFETLTDRDPTDSTDTRIPKLEDYKLRDFKQTGDLKKASELLPQLVDQARSRAGGDIEKFVDEFDKIKQNSYPTFINPDSQALGTEGVFKQYYNFLVRTQGKEEANKRLQDWMTRTMIINPAKTAPLGN